MHGGAELTLIGRIKTLKINAINERSVLNATGLEADDIIFLGNINSGSKVLLGKARTLKIRDINDQSLLNGSALDAHTVLAGAVNSRSTLKLHTPKGRVEMLGEINESAQIDIAAPDGRIVFKGINGNAKLTLLARDVEFQEAVNGPQTRIMLTFSKDGSLKFRRLSGGVWLHYRNADPRDPEPRIERGEVDRRAELHQVPAGGK